MMMTVKVNGQEVTSIDLNSYKLPNVGVGVGGGGYEPEVRNYQQVNSFGGEVPSLPVKHSCHVNVNYPSFGIFNLIFFFFLVSSFGKFKQDNTNEKIVSPDSERSKEEKTLRDFVPDLGVEDKLINIFHVLHKLLSLLLVFSLKNTFERIFFFDFSPDRS